MKTRTLKLERCHYAWVVVAVTFLVLLMNAAVRAAPGVLIKPLEAEFGWDRAGVSLAISIGILALGLGGPLSGGLIDRFGARAVALGASGLLGGGLLLLLGIRELWQLHLVLGVVIGLGTGGSANVLGAAVALRWFHARRGFALGLLGAAGSAGQLLFLPTMMALAAEAGWRSAVALLAGVTLALLVPLVLFMRDRPEQIGLRPLGADEGTEQGLAEEEQRTSLGEAARTRDFWLLAGSFFVCGYTTNGLIGTHLIPHAVEHGFSEAVTASTMAVMGATNIVGTLCSGWLTDRCDNRKLLATYYGLRALSIAALPLILDVLGLLLFSVVYGLDWIATLPPTTNLTAKRFGKDSVGTLFGWIYFAHMVGAALAAYAGGLFRDLVGDYHLVFVSAALLGFIAVGMSLGMSPPKRAVGPAVQRRGRANESRAPFRGGPAPVLLSDGSGVPVRPLRPTDRDALHGFLRRLSASSIRLRFFCGTPEVVEALARHYDKADAENQLVLAAFDPAEPGRIVAVAEYSRDPEADRAEFAVVVADQWQHRGLGLGITRRLLESACQRGIQRVHGYVLAENVGIHQLLGRLGLPRQMHWEAGVQRVELGLGPLTGAPPPFQPRGRLRAA